MSAPTRHPDVWDVAIALVSIGVGVALAASLLFLFIGAPMVMIGVELLMQRSAPVDSSRRIVSCMSDPSSEAGASVDSPIPLDPETGVGTW